MLTRLLSIVSQALALIIFSSGFFQWIPPTPRNRSMDAVVQEFVKIRPGSVTAPVFDKVVFMVIDALRADFVYSERFADGLKWLRQQRRVKKYIAMAQAPTVTLPRLKALTAGTSPRFLDLLSNLDGESVKSEDTWVSQTNVLHYGDNTWMRLFPGLPGEGTHSLFVTDTVEVDRNVTRHLDDALLRRDWTVLTLHYLGLDHIGHIGGVNSPLLIPKLQEMDGVIKKIYTALVERDRVDGTKSLLIILGDHGMTDGGNHGGASSEEIETGCVFLSPHYREDDRAEETAVRTSQVNLAPTVALILGLEVPRASTGRLITSILPEYVPESVRLDLLHKNAIQLLSLLPKQTPVHPKTIDDYERFCEQASKILGTSVGQYKLFRLVNGIVLMLISLVTFYSKRHRSIVVVMPLIIGTLSLFFSLSCLDMTSCILSIVMLVWLLARTEIPNMQFAPLVLCVFYAVSQFSSTFIEEEHRFWNFALTTLILLEIYKDLMDIKRHLIYLLLYRFIYYWNSTGYMYQNSPDARSWLLFHPLIESGLWFLSVVILTIFWFRDGKTSAIDKPYVVTCLISTLYKWKIITGIMVERIVLGLCGFLSLSCCINNRRRFTLATCLAFLVLLRRHNAIPLIIIAYLSEQITDPTVRLCLVHGSYFVLGPCHLIGSIDFSPAYIGQTSYHPVFIPIVGYFAIWAGPSLVGGVPHQWSLPFRSLVGIILLTSLTIHRGHVFIWTVFAPRLLFEFGWFLFYTIASFICH